MAQPYLGEIRMFGGNFAPVGWMFCSGQILPISEYESLFNLIGTTYGGDGQSTFALPNLQGRIPVHLEDKPSSSYVIGQQAGVESVTLTTQQIPAHTHSLNATSNPGTTTNPQGNVVANSPNVPVYIEDVTAANMGASMVGAAGGSQPHENMQPYLCVSFIISLFGIFPSQT